MLDPARTELLQRLSDDRELNVVDGWDRLPEVECVPRWGDPVQQEADALSRPELPAASPHDGAGHALGIEGGRKVLADQQLPVGRVREVAEADLPTQRDGTIYYSIISVVSKELSFAVIRITGRPLLEYAPSDSAEHIRPRRSAGRLHGLKQHVRAPGIDSGAIVVQKRAQRLVRQVGFGCDLGTLDRALQAHKRGEELGDGELGIALDLEQDAVSESLGRVPVRRYRHARGPLRDVRDPFRFADQLAVDAQAEHGMLVEPGVLIGQPLDLCCRLWLSSSKASLA
jgi:hypothetical protein